MQTSLLERWTSRTSTRLGLRLVFILALALQPTIFNAYDIQRGFYPWILGLLTVCLGSMTLS